MSSAALADLRDYLETADIHEVRRAQYASVALPFVITAVVAALLDLLVIKLFISGWAVTGTLLHLLVGCGIMAFAWLLDKGGSDCRFFYLLGLSNLTMSILGAVGSLLAFVLMLLFQIYSFSFTQWFQSIFPSLERRRAEKVHESIVSGRDEVSGHYPVVPFMDIMASGTVREKCDALIIIGERFSPRLAPVLKRALQDEDNAVRVLAATVLARIENRFADHSRQIDQLLEKHSDSKGLLLLAARHYDDYAFTGILDAQREHTNRERALELYLRYLALAPQDYSVMLNVGRIHLRQERYDEAANWLQRCMDRPELHEKALGWYLECLYRQGEFAELRRQAGQIRNAEGPGNPLREISRIWNQTQWPVAE